MDKRLVFAVNFLLICLLIWCTASVAKAQADTQALNACAEFAFSTEEDFVTQGPIPPDGNPIISDGDLLSKSGSVCLRNKQLLAKWELDRDLGLDAADVIDVKSSMVAFSTELDDPMGRFKSGDLLFTNGAVIPNLALLASFQVDHDMGLDAVHFVGNPEAILKFAEDAADIDREQWLDSGLLVEMLKRAEVDIWFSTEATERHRSHRADSGWRSTVGPIRHPCTTTARVHARLRSSRHTRSRHRLWRGRLHSLARDQTRPWPLFYRDPVPGQAFFHRR